MSQLCFHSAQPVYRPLAMRPPGEAIALASLPMLDHEGSRREFLELLAQLDDPAFIRRARQVEQAERTLRENCRLERNEQLRFPKMRLATIAALVEKQWQLLAPYLDEEFQKHLAELHDQWAPVLQIHVEKTESRRRIHRALDELATSFENFNQRWRQYLDRLDLTAVNSARDGYNSYYVIEKSCAFLSERIGREGFQRLPPFTVEDVLEEFPYLRVPRVR